MDTRSRQPRALPTMTHETDLPSLEPLVAPADGGLQEPTRRADLTKGVRFGSRSRRTWSTQPPTPQAAPESRQPLLWTADPIRAGAGSELRQVVGLLGDLRTRDAVWSDDPSSLRHTDFNERYRAIHEAQVQAEPGQAWHAGCEDQENLCELASSGLLHDVLLEGARAGAVASETGRRRGVVRATVGEMLLVSSTRGPG